MLQKHAALSTKQIGSLVGKIGLPGLVKNAISTTTAPIWTVEISLSSTDQYDAFERGLMQIRPVVGEIALPNQDSMKSCS